MGDETGLEDFLDEGLERGVFAAFEFVAHDRHFGSAVGLEQEQVAHAVGFHLDDHREVFAAEILVVVGAIEPRGGVVECAGFLEELVDAGALGTEEFFRALEHEMFEEVGGAGGASDFVFRTHAVGDHERQRGARVLGHEQHGEAVALERVFGDAADGADEGEAVDLGGGGSFGGAERGAEGEGGEGEGEETFHHKK